MSGHCHHVKEYHITTFAGPVSAKRPDARAHGGITRHETCACGAVRRVNIAGDYREVGFWRGGEHPRHDDPGHRHRPKDHYYHVFFGPVTSDPRKINPAAHGCTTRVDICACGAERSTNINGKHREVGPWVLSKE